MDIFNLSEEKIINQDLVDGWFSEEKNYLIICEAKELLTIQPIFNFAQETVEECINSDEFIRMETYDNYDFINLDYFYLEGKRLRFEEVNIYIGSNYLILIMSSESDFRNELIECILNKIVNEENKLNRIYYIIFNKMLLNFFVTLGDIEEEIQKLEYSINREATKEQLTKINRFRIMVMKIKKNLRPLLYVGDHLLINENGFIKKEYIRYFKNIDTRLNKLYDFSIDLVELINQLQYLYNSTVSIQTNRLNERLTIIATFFAPVTVITSIYGMNFQHIPELEWEYGYPVVMIVMVLITVGLYAYMKKKKWL